MVGPMRNSSGDPNLRTRLLAACVIVGMVVLTAPILVIPLLRALSRLVF